MHLIVSKNKKTWASNSPKLFAGLWCFPKNKNDNIIDALITINKLALVNDKSMPAILISGPILWTVNCCIGLLAI